VIPEGTLEGDSLLSAPQSGDFVSVPLSRAKAFTRRGLDVGAARWLQLRARIRVPTGAARTRRVRTRKNAAWLVHTYAIAYHQDHGRYDRK
jgi:hypothetical protein